jgi:hypothetical protein
VKLKWDSIRKALGEALVCSCLANGSHYHHILCFLQQSAQKGDDSPSDFTEAWL